MWEGKGLGKRLIRRRMTAAEALASLPDAAAAPTSPVPSGIELLTKEQFDELTQPPPHPSFGAPWASEPHVSPLTQSPASSIEDDGGPDDDLQFTLDDLKALGDVDLNKLLEKWVTYPDQSSDAP